MTPQENAYPMFLIPQELFNIIENSDKEIVDIIIRNSIGEEPQKPKSPKYKSGPYQPYLSSVNLDSSRMNFYIFLGIIIFTLLYLMLNKFSEFSVFFSLFLYGIPALYFLYKSSSKHSNYIEDKYNYESNYRIYLNELEEYNKFLDDYNLKKAEFELEMKKNEIKMYEYELRKKEFLQSNEFKSLLLKKRKEHLNQLISNFSTSIKKPTKSELEFKIGISENYFLQYLNRYFKNVTILKHFMLEYYEPDFTLVLENGLIIDIEIDEPYSGNTKEVIHYYDLSKKEFSDNTRNNYFLSNAWIVIRFSEQQIIEEPDSCCKFIGNILHYVNHKINLDVFKEIKDISSVKIWSKKEADEMAYFDYRKNYLTVDFLKRTRKNSG